MVCPPPPVPASATRAAPRSSSHGAPATAPTDLPARPRRATESTPATLSVRRRTTMTAARCGGRWCTTPHRRRCLRGVGQEPAARSRCAHAAPCTMPVPACSTRTHACTARAPPTPVHASRSLVAPLATLTPRRLRAPGLRAWRSRWRGAKCKEQPVSCRECVRVATSYVMLVVVSRV